MDLVRNLDSDNITALIEPVAAAFVPLLAAKRAEIEQVPRSTFQYGPLNRHQLDVYFPLAPPASGKTKILVFTYGGGFVTGDKQLAPTGNLVYPNVGAYFARRGFITVIPDYRLAPEAVFPGAAEDIRDAVVWVIKNPQHLTTPNSPDPDTQGIHLCGHSAGAIHVFTTLVIPETVEPAIFRSSIAGAILTGGGYHFDRIGDDTQLAGAIKLHYSGEEGMENKSPIALLKNASEETLKALPRILMVMAEKEPKWLLDTGAEFRALYERRTGNKMPLIVGKDHNHLSFFFTLSTGKDEDWAEEVVQWIGA